MEVREGGSANQGDDDGYAPRSDTGDGARGVHHVESSVGECLAMISFNN